MELYSRIPFLQKYQLFLDKNMGAAERIERFGGANSAGAWARAKLQQERI